MGKNGEKTTITEGNSFLGLFERLRKIASSMNMTFAALVKKVLSDFADQNEKKE